MPTTYNKTVFADTYKDDYTDSAGYARILFNSGRALQARELTQLQTIIQEEITRFGRNIFKEGAAVSAGSLEIDNNYRYVVLEVGSGDITDLVVGSELRNGTGVKAKVLEAPVEIVSNTQYRVYLRYTNSGATTPGTTEVTFSSGDSLNSGAFNVATGANTVGAGVKLYVDAGDFFAAGRFVYAPNQGLILNPTTRNYSGTVGFKIEQDIVTVNDTTALYDNTGDTPNVSAPGADRWRIRLTLTDKDDIISSDSFIFLCRVINSKIVEQVDENDAYNKINDMIAQRTYEESGNYLAEPFQLTFEDDDSTDSDIFAVVSPGIAYVRGYRVENQYPLKLKTPRPQAFTASATDFIAVDYGSYVKINDAQFANFADGLGGVQVNLYSGAAGTGDIGDAFIKSVSYDSPGVYRVYLDNIEMGTNNFNSVQSIGTSGSNYMVLAPSGILFEANKQTSLYPLSKTRPNQLTSYEYTYQEDDVVTVSSGTGNSTISMGAGESFVNETGWLVSNQSTGAIATTAVITDNGATFTLTGVADGTYNVVAQISRNNALPRTKTLTTGTFTTTITNGRGELDQYDLYDLTSVTVSGNDVTGNFIIDNGSRDTHYELGSVIDQSGDYEGLSVTATFRFFDHGNDEIAGSGNGLFFDFSSYTNIDYTEIPDHRMSDGTIINLRDYVDFRGKKLGGYIRTRQPIEGDPIQVNSSFYLSRADKLIVTEDGEFQILLGQQAEQPLFKKTPENSLELYKIVMNPNTLSPEDINTTFVEHKRYTMADIAKLERKLDNLEELYSLSFAELEAKLNPRLDDTTGDPKEETGILIDEVTDQTQSDTLNEDYGASVDPENKVIRPAYVGNNLRLVYSPSSGVNEYSSQNILVKGDNAYINHTETSWIDQPFATQAISINANSKSDYVGDLELSPSTDEWKSEQIGTRAVGGGGRIDTRENLLYNSWQWNWGGRAVEDLEVNPLTNYKAGARRRATIRENRRNISGRGARRLTATGGHVSRVIANETIRRVNTRGRMIDVAIIPWIRSRKIYFRATGLKPNTTFIPFFDGTNVADWCKSESTFVRWSSRTDDIGNQGQVNLTAHPDGSSALTSGADGTLKGSFYIPNVRETFTTSGQGLPNISANLPFRFKAGKKEFKLLDVNVNDINQAGSHAIATYNVEGMINTRHGKVTSTRIPKKGGFADRKRIKPALNAAEFKQYLSGLDPTDINLIEPHISGTWGGDYSQVINIPTLPDLSKLFDYVAVNENGQAGTAILPDQDNSTPFAQSFTVDNQTGVVVTAVDLFFQSAPDDDTIEGGENVPVTVEIVAMDAGRPGNEIVPGTTTTVDRGTIAANTSSTAATATTFTFDEPAYLDPGQEYAIVVKTPSPGYKIWVAKSGDFQIGSDEKVVSTQSANGKLFLPQTGLAGGSKEMDLAFTLKRAVFDTNASLVLRNAELPGRLLEDNPIVLVSGTTVAKVLNDCHGLATGELVTISGVEDANLGGSGVSVGDLNGTHTVVAADATSFTFTVPSITGTRKVGGDQVISGRNIMFTTANPQIETIVPNKCSTDMTAKFTSGQSIGGSESKFLKESVYTRIVADQNVDFNYPRMIAQRPEEEYDGTGNTRPYNGQSINGSGSGFSLDVKVDLKSSSDFVAPIVDLQRASMTLVQNCIDNMDAGNGDYIDNVEETSPSGCSGPARHITAPIKTVEPSESLDFDLTCNVPQVGNLDFYYRACMSGQNIFDKNWIKVEPTTPIVKDNDTESFRNVSIRADNIPKFTDSQLKAVFKSSNMAVTPSIKQIRSRTYLV